MGEITNKQLLKWFMYAYIFIVMISRSTGSTLVKAARLAFAGLFVLYYVADKNRVHPLSAYSVIRVAFLVYNVAMLGSAINQDASKAATMTLFYTDLINMMIGFYMFEEDIVEELMKVIIVSAIASAIMIYVRHGPLVFMHARSVRGIMSPNTLGLYTAMSTVFSLYFFKNVQDKRKRKKYIILAAVSLMLMFLTASRKAYMYVGFPIFMYMLLQSNDAGKTVKVIIISIIVVFVFYQVIMKVPFLYNMIGRRVEGLINGVLGNDADGSTAMRLKLIDQGIEWFKQKPLTGHGLGGFAVLFRRLHTTYRSAYYAHNNYIELLVDSGLIGFCIYYSLYVIILVRGLYKLKNADNITILFFGLFLSFIVGEYGMVTYYSPIFQLALLICYQRLASERIKGVFTVRR